MKFGEYLPDLPDRDNPGLTVATNCIPLATSYRGFPAPVVFSDGLTARCQGAISLKDKANNVFNYAGDATKLYSLSAVTWNDITRLSGGDYTTSIDGHWEFVKWSQDVIGVNGHTDLPQTITMGGANFADLAGTPPKAKHISVVRDFVVLGNITDGTVYPNRLHWSAFNSSVGWTAGTDQSDIQDLQSGGEIQRVVGGEYGIIFCDNSIWRMTYVGYPVVFQLDEVEPGRGTKAPGSVAQYGDLIFYLGLDGFYIFDGNQSYNIGANKVDKTFFEDFDTSYYDRISSYVDTENTIIYWSYPGQNNTSGLNNKMLAYNWTTKRFAGPIRVDAQIIIGYLSAGYNLGELTTVLGYNALTEMPETFGSPIWQGGEFSFAGFNSDNKLVTFSGVNLSALIETGELNINNNERAFITGVRPLYEGDGDVFIQVGSRDNVNGDISWSPISTPNSQTGLCSVRDNARYHRFRTILLNGFEHSYGLDVEYKSGGKK